MKAPIWSGLLHDSNHGMSDTFFPKACDASAQVTVYFLRCLASFAMASFDDSLLCPWVSPLQHRITSGLETCAGFSVHGVPVVTPELARGPAVAMW